MSDILFSVLVITYNQEQFLPQTLDSILHQEHNYKYEIVIGDDCSSDNTREIIRQYVNSYPDIIRPIFNEKNLGVIENYFNVLKNCTGKYIMECAGDDWWFKNKVKTQINYMEYHNDIAMCYGNIKPWYQDKQKFGKITGGSKETFDDLMLGNTIPAVTVCFRRQNALDYLSSEVKPLEKSWLMEDIPMWLFFSYNYKIKYINKVFAYYRMQSESLSHSKNTEKQNKFEKSCFEIREYYAKKYGRDDVLQQYILREKFNQAWIDRNCSDILLYGRSLLNKSYLDKIKIFFSQNSILMNLYNIFKKGF